MARGRFTDFMQTHRFWLFDVVPSLTPPFYVLGTPAFGFSSITVPEYTAETDEIKQMNSMFKSHAYSGGSVGSITLTRGVRGFDDTMWEWMYRAMTGLEVSQRHLLLLHFTNIQLFDIPGPNLLEGITVPGEDGVFLPGKAWLMFNCLPIRYKGASDFDAKSGDVSVAEIEVQPSQMMELTLADPL